MRQTAVRFRLARHTGVGARRMAQTDPAMPAPVGLPVGHPYLGLRNRWYLICSRDDLGREPQARRILGEDLVLWRDGTGPRLMEDRCPHRGARLSVGDVVDGNLQCWYHWWRFDGDGQCTSVPSQGGKCRLQAGTRIARTYPTVERHGYVWSWIGDGAPPELRVPAELADPGYSTFGESVDWAASWLLALENLADVMHAPFLHNKSLTLSGGLAEDRVLVTDTETGFTVERQSQAGVNFDRVEFDLGDLVHCRLDIPLRASFAGPGPDLRILGFVTPIDDQRTTVHFPRLRRVDGWRRLLWRTLFRLRLRGTHLHVLNQDKAILETLRSIPEAQRDEHLAQSDKPVLHLRRALQADFAAQEAGLGPEWQGTAELAGVGRGRRGPSTEQAER